MKTDRKFPEPDFSYIERESLNGGVTHTDIDITAWSPHVRVFLNDEIIYEGLTK